MKIITYWTEDDYDKGIDRVITTEKDTQEIINFLEKEGETIIDVREFEPTTAQEFIENYKDNK